MSWRDPQSLWAKRMRRRVQLPLWFGLGCVLLGAAFVVVMLWVSSAIGRMPILPILMIATLQIVLPLVFIVAWLSKERRIAQLVPAQDGYVCPFCREPTAEPNERNDVICFSCRRSYAAPALVRYWEQYVFAPRDAARWRLVHSIRSGSRTGAALKRGLTAIREKPSYSVMWMVLVFAVCGAVLGALQSSVVAGILNFLPMMFLMGGFALLMHGFKRRVGESRHCAACDYEQAPGAPLPQRCPECNAEWSTPGATVHGRAVDRPALIVAGGVLAAFGVVLIGLSFGGGGRLTMLLPTSSLMHQVIADRGFTMREWTELRTRSLTSEQQLKLARGLLALRERKMLSADADTWLLAQIQAGALPAELVDEYYRGMMRLELRVPEQARVGQPIEVGIDNHYAHTPFGNPGPTVFFGGFYLDDDMQPRLRASTPIYGSMLGRRWAVGLDDVPSADEGPTLRFAPSSPGELRVRCEMWLVMIPSNIRTRANTWNSDGSPNIPSYVVWSEPIVLERSVTVLP